MRITDLLKQSAIELNVSVANKQAAIDKLVSLHEKSGNLVNAAEYKKANPRKRGNGNNSSWYGGCHSARKEHGGKSSCTCSNYSSKRR